MSHSFTVSPAAPGEVSLGRVGREAGHLPTTHIPLLSSSAFYWWLSSAGNPKPYSSCSAAQDSAGRVTCSFSRREAAEPVAWAELSPQYTYLSCLLSRRLFPTIPLCISNLYCRTNVKIHVSVCDTLGAGLNDLQEVSLQESLCHCAGSAGSSVHPPKTPAELRCHGKTPRLCLVPSPAWRVSRTRCRQHYHLQPCSRWSSSRCLRLGNINLGPLDSRYVLVQHPVHGLSQGAAFA